MQARNVLVRYCSTRACSKLVCALSTVAREVNDAVTSHPVHGYMSIGYNTILPVQHSPSAYSCVQHTLLQHSTAHNLPACSTREQGLVPYSPSQPGKQQPRQNPKTFIKLWNPLFGHVDRQIREDVIRQRVATSEGVGLRRRHRS